MKFSEFAKTLFPYCANGRKQTDFVIQLTDKIMGGRPGRAHQVSSNQNSPQAGCSYQNPLRSKDERTLLAYFNGERTISQCDASIILSSVDKYKFEQYLQHQCSEDALELLAKDISRIAEIKDKLQVDEVCADLFVAILHDLATKKRK